MTNGAQCRWINGGRRLHLQHGPIDLIVSAQGDPAAVRRAYARAIDAFPAMLPSLVSELGRLRMPIGADTSAEPPAPRGAIARRMFSAASAYAAGRFVTPMVAVAGAVADGLLSVILSGDTGRLLTRVSVNNGGDIALYLQAGERFTVGICDNTRGGAIASTVNISHADRIGGIATSGWDGRSHSLGIADAVTVLAHNGASADCAATLIANAVDLPECAKIERRPAAELFPDSDLGNRLVTVAVGRLDRAEVDSALRAGQRFANDLLAAGMIKGAFIALQGQRRVIANQKKTTTIEVNS